MARESRRDSGRRLDVPLGQRRLFEMPSYDPESFGTNYLLSEALYSAQDYKAAAAEFTKTAYDYPRNPKSATAAYAALDSYAKYEAALSPAEKAEAHKAAIGLHKAGLRVGQPLHDLLGAMGRKAPPYLVGSALVRPDYRDIDLRLILPDDRGAQLDGGEPKIRLLLNIVLSDFVARAANLPAPVDFQIQSMSKANVPEHGSRNPMGIR